MDDSWNSGFVPTFVATGYAHRRRGTDSRGRLIDASHRNTIQRLLATWINGDEIHLPHTQDKKMNSTTRFSCMLLIGFLGSMLSACSSRIDAGSINLDNWKQDRYGCKNLRIEDLDEIKRIKNNFLGASNQALIKTLGRPDRVELSDKSQSFFFYFLEPSRDCGEINPEKEPLKVLFRMNAISKVSEVTITDLNP